MSNPLHLPDLTIKGFRGIDQLTMPRLGRVTLLAGKNGVGKTTVLEAVHVFAARGRFSALSDLLSNREEVHVGTDDNGDGTSEVDALSLFHRRVSEETTILIGPNNPSEQLQIEMTSLAKFRSTLLNLADPVPGLSVSFRGKRQVRWFIPSGGLNEFSRSQRLPENDEPETRLACELLGPDVLRESNLARFWDKVALTDNEQRAVSALQLIAGSSVTGVALIGDGRPNGSRRRTVVRLTGYDLPVPLKSLGDGAVRLYGIALALANSRGGLLLIDEAENGIHHTVQYEFWKLVLRTALANEVQVLATTHSWDCVKGFAYAAAEMGEAEGLLVRLDRDDRGLRAVEYSEEDLKVAADQGIEVR
jgi:predicted ATPase